VIKVRAPSRTQIKNYHELRLKRFDYSYRLKRRTQVVLDAIKKYSNKDHPAVLDVGTADGLMLNALSKSMKISQSVGLDVSTDSYTPREENVFKFVQGDASNLPFKNEGFDVVVATALIEHVPDVNKTLKELNRVCAKRGICIITTPNPLMDRMAAMVGYDKSKLHVQTFTISQLEPLLRSNGFNILKAERFMISPIGFPCELKIERAVKALGLDFLMLNQLVVGRKIS